MSHVVKASVDYIRRMQKDLQKSRELEPRPRGCSGLGEPRPALPSF